MKFQRETKASIWVPKDETNSIGIFGKIDNCLDAKNAIEHFVHHIQQNYMRGEIFMSTAHHKRFTQKIINEIFEKWEVLVEIPNDNSDRIILRGYIPNINKAIDDVRQIVVEKKKNVYFHSNFQDWIADAIKQINEKLDVEIVYVDNNDIDDYVVIKGYADQVDEAECEIHKIIDELKKDEDERNITIDPKLYNDYLKGDGAKIYAAVAEHKNVIKKINDDGSRIFVRGPKNQVKAAEAQIKDFLAKLEDAAKLAVDECE